MKAVVTILHLNYVSKTSTFWEKTVRERKLWLPTLYFTTIYLLIFYTNYVLKVYTETDDKIGIRLLNFKDNGTRVRLAAKSFDFLMVNADVLEKHVNYLRAEIYKTAKQLLEFAKSTSNNINLSEDVLRINNAMIKKFETIINKVWTSVQKQCLILFENFIYYVRKFANVLIDPKKIFLCRLA